MKMTKRLLSAALSLCLAAGLVPWTVTPAKAEAQTYTGFTADGGSDSYACLVDGDPATHWVSNNKSIPPDGPGNCLWVDFHADSPIYVDRYSLTNSDDAACDPSTWVLEAKKNAEDAWTQIAAVENDTVMTEPGRSTAYEFALSAPGTYQYFRFMVFATVWTSGLKLSELTFSGEPPVTPPPEPEDTVVRYLDETGKVQTAPDTISGIYRTPYEAKTDWTGGWYRADGSVSATDRITVSGDVKLILMDGCEINAPKGITVNNGSSLTVYAQSTDENTMGRLIAELPDAKNFAAIGGDGTNPGSISGAITINGGKIHAKCSGSDSYGAGIGGGAREAGNVTINGGLVEAKGHQGAGIGTGAGATIQFRAPGITINGGTVTAEAFLALENDTVSNNLHIAGASGAAGIGGGNLSYGGVITINGGMVSSKGRGGAGIGNGGNGSGNESIYGFGCSISINGGTVNAYGYAGGAAIGGGCGYERGNDVKSISITGGTVKAESDRFGGAAIGGGRGYSAWGGDVGTISISGGTVTARCARSGNGTSIGGGQGNWGGDVGTISISGGKVSAYGNQSDCTRIGGGYGRTGGDAERINITGGTVINITGGTVTVDCQGQFITGIGAGRSSDTRLPTQNCTDGKGPQLTISGGSVTLFDNPGSYGVLGIGSRIADPDNPVDRGSVNVTGGTLTVNLHKEKPGVLTTVGVSEGTPMALGDGVTAYVGGSEAEAALTATGPLGDLTGRDLYMRLHRHSYTFAVNQAGDAITAACADQGAHGTAGFTDSLTILPPAKAMDTDTASPEATLTGSIEGVTLPDIVYRKGGQTLSAPPTDAGTYTASVTLEGVTASVQYTIQAAPTLTVKWLNGDGSVLDTKTYKEGQSEPSTSKTPTKAADANYTYSFDKWDSGKVSGNTKTYTPLFTSVTKPASGTDPTTPTDPTPGPQPAQQVLTGSVKGGRLSYTVTGAPANALLIAARYDGGRLTDVQTVSVSGDAEETLTMKGKGDEFRLFLLNGTSLTPVCAAWSS